MKNCLSLLTMLGCALPACSQLPPAAPINVVTPPKPARVFDDFSRNRDVRAQQIAAWPTREQPKELAQALVDLQQGSVDERVAKLKAKALADLIFVEGGSFVMGEWGQLRGMWSRSKYNAEQLSLFRSLFDRRPGHDVTLSSFWISRYKTTFAEFDVFTDATGAPRAPTDKLDEPYRYPTSPAGVPWIRADAYCHWLGKITGKPFALPTEAQWEYAARSRGQNFIYATDDGHLRQGVNTALNDVSRAFAPTEAGRKDSLGSPYPVGLFAPSPLGLYDMNGDGGDWVSDWYSPTYYDDSPVLNPTGPANGTEKVIRGFIDSAMIEPHVLMRRSRPPNGLKDDPTLPGKKMEAYNLDKGFRCAVQAQR